MVQRVSEDNVDVAEDCDVAVDFCNPVFAVRCDVKATCPRFDAVNQVEPVPVVDGEERALSGRAQRPESRGERVDVVEEADVGLHCHLERV